MHRLAINLGNTHIRFGIFPVPSSLSIDPPLKTYTLPHPAKGKGHLIPNPFGKEILPQLREYSLREVVIVSVTPAQTPRWATEIKTSLGVPIKILTHDDFTDLDLSYSPSKGIGIDRLVKLWGTRKLYPKKAALILDFGTALTIDVLDTTSYLGGMILPGYGTSFRSLHTFTEQLPLLTPSRPSVFLSRSTEECITGGIFHLYAQGISGIICKLMAELFSSQDFHLLITGGDAAYFQDHLPITPIMIDHFNLIAANRLAEERIEHV